MNVKLEGMLAQIVEQAVQTGLVKTKIEALRAGLLELNSKYSLLQGREAELGTERITESERKELRRIMKEMDAGKRYSLEDAFG